MTALTIGQFVRVQAPHPLQGMTGTVDYVEGGDVYVTLTAWGTDRLFSPRDLAPEERVPVAVADWRAARQQPNITPPEPVVDRAAEQRRRSAERMRERRRRQAAERVSDAVAALPPAAAREVSPFRRRVREKLRERAA